MASKQDLVKLPDKVLRQKSQKISSIDASVKSLIRQMVDVSLDWEESRDFEVCVGLAAVQIGVLKKVVILRTEKSEDKKFDVFINPKIIKTYGEQELDFEGCLSVKDIYGLVPRYPKVKVQAMDENGEIKRTVAEGFRARLIQHEVDHTKGIMFVDHIKDIEDAFYEITDEGKIERIDYAKVKAAGIFR